MNIGIASSREYLFFYKTMLRSLVENNKDVKDEITVYYLNSDLTDKEVKAFGAWCNSIGLSLKYIFIDSNILPEDISFSKSSIHALAAYYRLLLPYFVPEDLERIIYLDGDMIINGSIEDLYNIDFENNLIAAAPDAFCFGGIEKINTRIGLPKEHLYFNAGMLMMNLIAIRNEYSLDDVFQCARRIQDNMEYGDQDILNVLFQDKVKNVSMLKYNLQVLWHTSNVDCSFLSKYDTRIIHYLCKRKPNNYLYANTLKKLFWKYAKMNGCYGRYLRFCIVNPISTVMWKLYAKITNLEHDCELDYYRFERLRLKERTVLNER